MNVLLRRTRTICLVPVVCCLLALDANSVVVAAEGMSLVLAQAAPAPVMPSNVKKIGRAYWVEGVVVAALMGGALYAVCRGSRRT